MTWLAAGLGVAFCTLAPTAHAQGTTAAIPESEGEDAASMAPSVGAVWGPAALRPRTRHAPRRRSMLQHHVPSQYSGPYGRDEGYGYRSPAAPVRHPETAQVPDQYYSHGDPTRVARFGNAGGAPTRMDQFEAQKLGIASNFALQQHIDNYARPPMVFGFGFGFGGGFGGFY
ncbi:hypothetical protein OJF2_53960 [Aquisphaera giovannonii]|uniref:Uncharacterized protein n=1 Tax=Aquisphaera giovannonii TaxID=406548 RepID=A0A5B9W9Q2_9BACT|nr:hypothetical protein OJF2_53960 [Aquisphaera giovannonii]